MTALRPAPNPCASCPYRQDVPSGIWAAEEYEKLPLYDGEMGGQPTQLFQCHQNERGDKHARLCAGWLACHNPYDLLAIRLAGALGRMDDAELRATLDYHTDVPVFVTGEAAAEHGMRDIGSPDEAADKAIAKISRRRTGLRYG